MQDNRSTEAHEAARNMQPPHPNQGHQQKKTQREKKPKKQKRREEEVPTYTLPSLKTPEDIAKWIEQRKKNYPTDSNIEKKVFFCLFLFSLTWSQPVLEC
jgi:hypothetical protein